MSTNIDNKYIVIFHEDEKGEKVIDYTIEYDKELYQTLQKTNYKYFTTNSPNYKSTTFLKDYNEKEEYIHSPIKKESEEAIESGIENEQKYEAKNPDSEEVKKRKLIKRSIKKYEEVYYFYENKDYDTCINTLLNIIKNDLEDKLDDIIKESIIKIDEFEFQVLQESNFQTLQNLIFYEDIIEWRDIHNNFIKLNKNQAETLLMNSLTVNQKFRRETWDIRDKLKIEVDKWSQTQEKSWSKLMSIVKNIVPNSFFEYASITLLTELYEY